MARKRTRFVLFFTSYIKGSHLTKRSHRAPIDVTVDLSQDVWYYKKDTPLEEKFRIGSDVRIPFSDELEGPMFVGDAQDGLHILACAEAEDDLQKGVIIH